MALRLLAFAGLSTYAATYAAASASLSSLPESTLQALNETVKGRLSKGTPVALPCYSKFGEVHVESDEAGCATAQQSYGSSPLRAASFGTFMQPQWETCQATQQQCLLDSSDPANPVAFENATCSQGSISPYYIDVREASDVQAAFAFAKRTGVSLSIKNSGHDYKGRSSAPGSLSLWVHNLQSISHDPEFIPEGCTGETYSAVTAETGAPWQAVYEFAEERNITVIGGYHQTVAASGGWLLGGGHSILSPVYGLGADRVLQFKVVTPDGELRIANECQNTDLFWALRGGGGGTFGVVLEATHKAEKQIEIQVAGMLFQGDPSKLPEFYSKIVDNSLRWGQEGWGGHVAKNFFMFANPVLDLDGAKKSMRPLAEMVMANNGIVIIESFPSWGAFFKRWVVMIQAHVGVPLTITSRLIPQSVFETESGRETMSKLASTLPEGAIPYITVVPPVLYKEKEGATSVTPAWRNSLWHFVVVAEWHYNSTLSEIEDRYALIHRYTEEFRAIAPDSGSYFSEGDVYEPDYQQSYWGPNYPRLLSIKEKYDPDHLLDCWQCVGWKGPSDERYSCFLPSPETPNLKESDSQTTLKYKGEL